ncbi:MAG: BamA/TamA family outer membrane protein [Candidatus Cloacimonetes bacterium]|nr:BamA/TamA family outer membrane protein [Candidatus Cloacimonadota bacterium]NLO11988.1 BamA/TamA family outer membrane protein [Candidatus Cloacimonadota bacterium]
MRSWLFLLPFVWLSALSGLNIHQLRWEANFAINEAALEAASGLYEGQEYQPELIREALVRLQAYLEGTGRYFVKIPYPELIPAVDSKVDLVFDLKEIVPSDELELRFGGMRYFSEARLKEMLLIGANRRFSLSDLPRVYGQILDICHQRGFLFASVELDSLVWDEGLVAWLKVNEGKAFTAEKVYFEGNHHTRESTLLKLSGVSNAKVVTPQILETATQNILRKPYIHSALVEPISENSLLIKVEEGRMTFLEGVFGYGGKEKGVTGRLHLKFLNLLGSNRSIELDWHKDQKTNGLELAYHESGPSSIPIAGDIFLQRSTLDSLWIKSSASLDIYGYKGHHKLGLELGSDDHLIDPSLARRPSHRIRSATMGAFWAYDSAFPAGNPLKGSELRLGYGMIYSSSKRWRGAFELDSVNYLPLSGSIVAAMGLNIRNLEDPNAADYELYQMGGYQKLRGYGEGEWKSWRLGWASWELRWRLDAGSRLHAFFDHGVLARWLQQEDGKEIGYKADIYGFGIGARIRTRLGILGIDYALGKREDGIASLGEGMIHLGLDTAF